MASIQQRGRAWQLRVKHRLLPRAFFATFSTEAEARTYGEQLESLLARGIVPVELLAPAAAPDDLLLTQIVADYAAEAPGLTESDDAMLGVLMRDKPVIGVRVSAVTYRWVESYVAWLKSPAMNLAPSSVRKRIGALGRVMDWHLKRTVASGPNVFRMLPRGYSAYTKADTGEARRDVARDRRLAPEEAQRIDAVLAGFKRADRERVFTTDPAFDLLYRLIVDTGLRLSEAYRLRVDSVDLDKNILRVEGSKGHRGAAKPRVVPIKPVLRDRLRAWCIGRVGLLFPYWDGSREGMKTATNRLAQRFRGLFDYAQVADFSEHDLRHEATCRWFELRRPDGAWVFSEVEIAKIMGWSDLRMALRYASIRGEDLAARLG